MKKLIPMKKLLILLIGISILGLLSGCREFDASRYVQGLLNTLYRNDHRISLETGMATEKEAKDAYLSLINSELDALAKDLVMTEEQRAEFFDAFEQIYRSVKYSVGTAKKQKDKSYLVPVSVEKMHVLKPATEAYRTEMDRMLQEWTADAIAGNPVPTQEEMENELVLLLKDCMVKACGSAVYDPAETINIRVYKEEDAYTISEEDLRSIAASMLDVNSEINTEEAETGEGAETTENTAAGEANTSDAESSEAESSAGE